MADVNVDIIKIDTNQASNSMKSLKQEMKEVREQMMELRMNGDETSETYKKLAARAGELAKAQRLAAKDINEASTTFSNTVSYVSGSLAGVSGAVQACTGALSLMGVEMGNDSKLMKVLVSAMSMTSGLQAIQGGVEAFKLLTTNIKRSTIAQKAFNAAMKANPIGLVIAGVVALTAAVVALASAFDDAADAQAKLQQQANAEKMQEAYSELERKLNIDIELMELEGKSDYEIYEQRKKNAKALRDEAERNFNYYIQLIEEGKAADEDAAQEQVEFWSKAFDERAHNYQVLIERNWVEYSKDAKKKKEKEEADAKRRKEQAAREAENRKREREAELREIAKIERNAQIGLMGGREGELAKLKDEFDEQVKLYQKRGQDITTITEYYNQQVAAINKKFDDEEREAREEAAQKAEEAAREARERELEAAQEKVDGHELELLREYWQKRLEIINQGGEGMEQKLEDLDFMNIDREMTLLQESYDNQLITSEEYETKRLELENEMAEKRIKIKKDEAEKKKAIEKGYLQSIQSITGSIGGILGSLGDMMEDETETQKNLKAAQAIINTIAGAVAAFMGITESTGGWGIAAAIAQAAAVTASGMAQVAQIYAVDTKGGKNSTSNTGISAGSVSTLSQNYSNTRLVANGGGVYDLSGLEEQQQNTRVYVLTSDIQTGLNRVNVTTAHNTF